MGANPPMTTTPRLPAHSEAPSAVRISRRAVLTTLTVAAAGTCLPAFIRAGLADPVIKKAKDLKPGEFTWHPERSPKGPVAIVVSIPDQRVHVYRNAIRIAVSTCSTGAPGHATPTGVFMILEKDKNHRSSTYNNAPMPNMNRLTWGGVALHAGNLPGYPASHGCIRLPLKFSELLFGITKVGTPVILAGSHSDPREIVHPGLVLGNYATKEFETVKRSLKKERLPWQAEVIPADETVAVVVSHGDMTVTLVANGVEVATGKAYITNPEQPIGRHVFILVGASEGRRGMAWQSLSHHDEDDATRAPDAKVIERLKADQAMLNAIQDRMHPGMLLVTTELPAHAGDRGGDDFVLMNTHES
ncbi:MAG: L,D-transpeptidase family protein [Hyphomicrobium sp.]|nr:L,D-transpeptidase family protein [Hyphomicrobium sp.]